MEALALTDPSTRTSGSGDRGGVLRCLVARTKAGDGASREELAERSGRAAYSFALQLVRNQADAQDVAQDSMIRFFSSLDRFDEQRPVLPWLFRIVRNRVVDLGRRESLRRGPSLDTGSPQGEAIDSLDSKSDPHQDSERRDLQRRIWASLEELQEPHREILVLRDYQDLSYRQIAEVLEIPQGTVMSRLHAARKRLRARLLESGWIFGEKHHD
jgi:RNA polymerase sigma-70 factor (ECF subfamily)